ncbi:uncharacterized protein FSUBG_4006 [Fusarium subglutinans]|uniref:Uncharacterized protein n=1 Tax=Gibberella subglutinans TaxID=42677 RepID=A0A8H5Q7P4_GIBSU|nr:uncharacterized protein FSUBG_4006 [Fusarium subglutinans]KAF5609532.1 hypothetical protein FSUBG_4006 [Fusarium subglutinans]
MAHEYKKTFDPKLPIYKHDIPRKLVKGDTELNQALIDIFGAWDFKFVNRYDATKEMITVETNDDTSMDLKKKLQEKGALEQD